MSSNRVVTYIDTGLNSVEEYWQQIVLPDVQEFRAKSSVRALFSAALGVWHFHDWVWHDANPGQDSRGQTFDAYRSHLLASCPELGWLRDLADAGKHRGLGRLPEVKEAAPKNVLSALYAATGVPFTQLAFFVVLNDGSVLRFDDVLRTAVDYWRVELEAKNLPSP
jgi:hypothetical protein